MVFEPVCQSEARTPFVPPSLSLLKKKKNPHKVAACGRDSVCRHFLPRLHRVGAVICYSATNTWWHCGVIALEGQGWTGERGPLIIWRLLVYSLLLFVHFR